MIAAEPAVAADVVLAGARNHAAERRGRYADGAENMRMALLAFITAMSGARAARASDFFVVTDTFKSQQDAQTRAASVGARSSSGEPEAQALVARATSPAIPMRQPRPAEFRGFVCRTLSSSGNSAKCLHLGVVGAAGPSCRSTPR